MNRGIEWSDRVEVADWWIERLRPFGDHVVGSMVPAGYEAVTRIFHPIDDDEDEDEDGTLRR